MFNWFKKEHNEIPAQVSTGYISRTTNNLVGELSTIIAESLVNTPQKWSYSTSKYSDRLGVLKTKGIELEIFIYYYDSPPTYTVFIETPGGRTKLNDQVQEAVRKWFWGREQLRLTKQLEDVKKELDKT